jgi:hypothetical protein
MPASFTRFVRRWPLKTSQIPIDGKIPTSSDYTKALVRELTSSISTGILDDIAVVLAFEAGERIEVEIGFAGLS